ncbi:MAG: hypothetical protein FH753_10385 [Firmicutes bacterium]|nr:hypothetical protein [Bacillota bacterium]
MEFYRANENDFKYIKHNNSISHNTALIARKDEKVIGVLEYKIKNFKEAEITNYDSFDISEDDRIFKGLIEELNYWAPYLRTITYCEENNPINTNVLFSAGFKKNLRWSMNVDKGIDIFRINIEEITPEQLSIDEVKLDRVCSWIKSPEDIVVNCIKIDDKIVCIDGYSRLMAAYKKGFEYVYAYIETEIDNIEFYKTCLGWCEENNIYSIKDLTQRIVTPEEHNSIWISRCQAYFNDKE